MSRSAYTDARYSSPGPIVIAGWPREGTPLEINGACDPDVILRETCQHAVRRFLHGAMRLCNAGSAGLSVMVEGRPDTLCWQVVAGALAAHEGRTVPRERTPCGICLDTHRPIIFSDPERVFPELRHTYPWMSQVVAVPLYDAHKAPMGALWLAQHGTAVFSDEQCRIAQQLAMPLVRSIKLLGLLVQQGAVLRDALDDLEQERSRRQLAESAYQQSQRVLESKKAELREAHHRVKNTIQMAATVLQLQARASPSSQVREALRDGQARLRSLAAVHELLQSDPGAVEAVAMPKLLGVVVDALRHAFAERAPQVTVEVCAEPLMLPSEVAMPLALIANEAVTNAYKHAFTDERPGELTLTLRRLGANGLLLRIGDNGVGLKVSCDSKQGLGLSFMEGFAQQLHGVIALSAPAQGRGTVVTVSIQDLAATLPAASDQIHA